MTKRVAIVGTAPLSLDLAPFDDPAWDIWACSSGNAFGRLRRVTEWYELHAIREMMSQENKGAFMPFYAWLRTQSFPVYMQEKNELVPQALVYPLQAIVKEFGRNWLTSSISLMMAYAIWRKYDEIGIFGVDMAHESEYYSLQKPGCLRFIEIAKERGITVSVPDESCLGCQPPIYGYNEATHRGRRWNAMLISLQSQRAALAADINSKTLQMAAVDGNIQSLQYMIRTWVDGSEFDPDHSAAPGAEEARPVSLSPRVDDFAKLPSGMLIPKGLANGGSGTGGHAGDSYGAAGGRSYGGGGPVQEEPHG